MACTPQAPAAALSLAAPLQSAIPQPETSKAVAAARISPSFIAKSLRPAAHIGDPPATLAQAGAGSSLSAWPRAPKCDQPGQDRAIALEVFERPSGVLERARIPAAERRIAEQGDGLGVAQPG